MSTANTWKLHGIVSTVMAAAIVAAGGLALDQGHVAAARHGVIEVGELTPVTAAPRYVTLLPEVVVHGERLASTGHRTGA